MTLNLILAGMIILMIASLIVYLVYLYSSKERSERIERRGMIPFSDDPLESNERNNH